jgi:hypothetical protein
VCVVVEVTVLVDVVVSVVPVDEETLVSDKVVEEIDGEV